MSLQVPQKKKKKSSNHTQDLLKQEELHFGQNPFATLLKIRRFTIKIIKFN